MIKEFQGEYRFLSNFWPAEITYEGITYPSVEHAYQAAKTLDKQERVKISKMKAGEAKRAGRKVKLRSDWEAIKLSVMRSLVQQKFSRHDKLAKKLIETGDQELQEGNNWGDKFWGVVGNTGLNHLGKILMSVRKDLIEMYSPVNKSEDIKCDYGDW